MDVVLADRIVFLRPSRDMCADVDRAFRLALKNRFFWSSPSEFEFDVSEMDRLLNDVAEFVRAVLETPESCEWIDDFLRPLGELNRLIFSRMFVVLSLYGLGEFIIFSESLICSGCSNRAILECNLLGFTFPRFRAFSHFWGMDLNKMINQIRATRSRLTTG